MRKNRILYLTLLLLSFVFIYFYGGKVPYVLFYAVLLLPVVSLAYTLVIYMRFKYTQDVDNKFITKGEKVNFLFSVHNEDFLLYPYIKVAFCGAETFFGDQFQTKCFSILPSSEKTFSFELECKYRGYYAIGIKTVEIQDFLGIFNLRYRISEPKYITVYPKIVRLDRMDIKATFLSESHTLLNTLNQDMTTISDIRKYVQGDNFKRIHWKLTAKMGGLMSKNFQSTSQASIIIIVDLMKSPYSMEVNAIIEDKAVEAAIAVIYYCLSNWIPVNLIYYKDGITDIQAKTPLDFNGIYKLLSEITFEENIHIRDIMNIYLNESVNKTNVMVITSNIDYGLYDEIYKAKFSGYEASLVYISPEEVTFEKNPEEEPILSFLPEIGVDTYKININDNIKQILER